MANIRGNEEDRNKFWEGFGIKKKEPKYESTRGKNYFIDSEGNARLMRWDKGLFGKMKNVTIDDEPWEEFTSRTGLTADDFESISYDEYIKIVDRKDEKADKVWE